MLLDRCGWLCLLDSRNFVAWNLQGHEKVSEICLFGCLCVCFVSKWNVFHAWKIQSEGWNLPIWSIVSCNINTILLFYFLQFFVCIFLQQIDRIDSQVSEATTKYEKMRTRIKQTFADLQRALTAREQDLLEDVREREDSFNKEKKARRDKLDKLRTILAAHTKRAEKLIASAPDRALLAMMNNLKARLNDLESEKPASELDDGVKVGDIHFNERMVSFMKKWSRKIGELTDNPLAQVCKVKRILCMNYVYGQYILLYLVMFLLRYYFQVWIHSVFGNLNVVNKIVCVAGGIWGNILNMW